MLLFTEPVIHSTPLVVKYYFFSFVPRVFIRLGYIVKLLNMPVAQLAGDEESGDKCHTFVFQDEGHTLGNALRCVISSYPDVQFCGYTVPHPAESKMHFRIQMRKGRAVDVLKKGLEDLVKMCDHTLDVFNTEVETFKSST